jgi:hypothetical protein
VDNVIKHDQQFNIVRRVCLLQYKVLSVLPGSGMGISIATPATQKVQCYREGDHVSCVMHRVSMLSTKPN